MGLAQAKPIVMITKGVSPWYWKAALAGLLAVALACFAIPARAQSVMPVGAEDAALESAPLEPVPNQLLIRFQSGASQTARESVVRRAAPKLKRIRHLSRPSARLPAAGRESVFANLTLIEAGDGVEAAQASAELARRSEVLYVEPNYRLRLFAEPPPRRLPSDFEFGSQWALLNSGQGEGQPGNDIRAVEAWPVVTDASRVRVAVIDTGIDYYHPDLEANVWVNPGEIPGNGLDDDSNGYVDDVHGYDFVSDDGDPMDDQSHGSHVAGIIGAVGDNRIGVAGVCWKSTLLAIKAFDEHGEGTVAGVVEALRYAVDNNARILNASWGHSDKSRILQEAVSEAWAAGVLIVAAAGNERNDIAPFPAAYEPVVAVAALNHMGQRAMFSNFGAFVDLAAPGEAVLSTTPNARYDLLSGTSMAAPHVSGVAALVLALHPEFTNEQLATILRNSVEEIGSDQYIGTGRLNAGKAVRVQSPLPLAKLGLSKVISGRVDLLGTAAGEWFASYRLEYGTGTYPTNWTRFHTASQAIVDGPLFKDFSSALLGEGTYSIRLVVTDRFGQEAQDRAVATVRNVHLTSPASNDSIRAGDRVALEGTVFGAGRSYTIEHGAGLNPETWSSAGVELVDGGQSEVFDGLLGWFDTSHAETNAFHSLRLRAYVNGAVVGEWRARLVYLDGQLRPGWPVHLPATGLHPTNDWRHVTVADLDGDGTQEILRVHPGSPPGSPARLLVLEPDGQVRWARDLAAGEPVSDIPVAGDVDGDGKLEVFTDAGEERLLYGFNHDGSPLVGAWPVPLPAPMPGKVLADLDRDGRLELIGLANGADQPLLLFVLDAEGHLRASWRVEPCWASPSWPRRVPAVGNFDEDEDLEIVAPTGCSQIAMFDLKDPTQPVWVRDVNGHILASPVTGDLDGDGWDEVLVGTQDPYAVGGRGVFGGLFAFTAYGNPLPGWPVMLDTSFATAPALADVDGDGDLEIAVVDTGSRELHLLHHDGFDVQGWPVSVAPIPSLNSAPVIVDIDGDSRLDLVAAVPGLLLPAMYDGDFRTVGGVRAWRLDGSPIPLGPRADLPGLFLESGAGFSRFKAAQVTVTDLDGNGFPDIVASSIDDIAYSLEPPVSTRKERYSLYAWEIRAPIVPGPRGWPMFQRDPQHSGYLASPVATNQPPVIASLPNQTTRVGGTFFPIELSRYVDDPDHNSADIGWSIEGGTNLEARLDDRRVLLVRPRNDQWTGSETLRLRATDPEGAQDEAAVVYSVRADYNPPVARDDAVVTSEDTPVEVAVLGNDEHPQGLPLVVESTSRPLNGKVVVRPNGVLRYSPDPDFHGSDSFTYLVLDGRDGMALASVTVQVASVPDDPVAKADHVSLDEDTPVDFDVLENDADPDQESLTLVSYSQATNGVVTLNLDGRLRYTPTANWFGDDGFEYVIADSSGAQATGVVQIVVKPVNDEPRAEDQFFSMNRNTYQDVFYQAEDPDGSDLTFQILDGPQNGELWAYPDIATYYPHHGFAGTDGFTYTATDGSTTSRVATVTFRVLDANNPPKTEPLEIATRVNRPLTFALSATDADGDEVNYEILLSPAHGTLEPAGTNFVFTPQLDYLGPDTFTFRAGDGRDFSPATTVQITVTDQNTPPVANDSSVEVRLNTPTEIFLRATDGEGDALRYMVLTNPIAGELSGTPPALLYTPLKDYVGPDRFSFQASDDHLDSAPATVTLLVVPLNRMPVASNQTVRLPADQPTLLMFDLRDPDGDPLRVAILKGPRLGRLYGLGTNFVYAPKSGATGVDGFTYKAWDGHIYSEIKTVTLQLETPPPPQPPRFEAIDFLPGSLTVRLTLKTEPGKALQLQRSTDLRSWTTFTTVTPEVETVEILDAGASAEEAVFYRAIRDGSSD